MVIKSIEKVIASNGNNDLCECVGMVISVQQHQQTLSDENQDKISNISIEDRNIENCRSEIVHSIKDSAVSITENDSIADSSTQCSNVEDDNETDIEEGDWIPDLPVPTVFQQHQEVTTADGNIVLPNADISNFGNVRVKNSTNVHLGNKTFYKGPVTIKQFVYTNPTSIQDLDTVKNDIIGSNTNTSDLSTAKGDSTVKNSILSQNPDLVTKWLRTWRYAAFLCILALILVIIMVIVSIYFTRNSAIPSAVVFPEIPDSLFGDKIKNIRFIERKEWGAQPPTTQLIKMKLPVPYVIISHTATQFCSTQSECTFYVRFAQTFHIESRNWSDIGYNFLVGGDGYVYVGRSWDYMGAHAFGYNNISIGISFIGTFNTVKPSKQQLYVVQKLIELGVEKGKIAPDYKLLGHRQVSQTVSPGDALYSVIQTWPHWSKEP
ncbi:peptidoglycan-recognition protein LC isoform X3 [Apis mellifera]|uniref:Peptidoglycan-recognition protein LC isoform X3 n=2 Tax=Apis mellifera TaxID=7460 RepID=A0A7M7GXP9_APIME|nr:peptidoglycan-recognition protein LC isoform X3 [Apis mellifera]|eukprot:XP_006565566.1 peptidoglycan-recognition protein LC isoform X3 [Apis mellifera]